MATEDWNPISRRQAAGAIKFHCTYCGQAIESACATVGQLMTCSNCSSGIPVPPERETLLPKKSQPMRVDTDVSPLPSSWGRGFRRMFLFSLLACFVFGALTAILAMLSLELREIQVKIILTTLSLGIYSISGLCCSVLGKKRQYLAFSRLGIAASIVGALFAILTNWEIITGWETLIKGRISFLIIAFSFGHAALLLMIDTTSRELRTLRVVTLGIIACVAALVLNIVLDPGSISLVWTILSILGILDVLGTIAIPIVHLTRREPKPG